MSRTFRTPSKRGALLIATLTCAVALFAQSNAPDPAESNRISSFLQSAAAGMLRLAWPTVAYRDAEFYGFVKQPDGIAVVMKVSGTGLGGRQTLA